MSVIKQVSKGEKSFENQYKLSGELFWARVHEPDQDGKLSLAVKVGDDKDVLKFLEENNIKTEVKEGLLNIRRKVKTAKGKALPALAVMDAKKNRIPKNLLIGNGSKGHVIFTLYDYEFRGKKGKAMQLEAVQVVDLVEYVPQGKAAELFDEEEGLDLGTSNSSEDFIDVEEI